MVKVFGSHSCGGCAILLGLLVRKGIEHEFYDVNEADGLAELASYGLADELAIPIVIDQNGKKDLEEYEEYLNQLPDAIDTHVS